MCVISTCIYPYVYLEAIAHYFNLRTLFYLLKKSSTVEEAVDLIHFRGFSVLPK